MADDTAPVPFVEHESGAWLHGTRADLSVGDLVAPGHPSNFTDGSALRHVYVTHTLDAAAWGAELAAGDDPPRIYRVEPLGPLEDDPNVTDKRFPGNPTRSFRSLEPMRVVGELESWTGHSPDQITVRRASLAELRIAGRDLIID